MLVKEILKISADFLELKNVKKYLNSEVEISDEIEEEINNLLLGLNMVNNTIAASYIDLNGIKKIDTNNKVIPFSDISQKSIIEIKSVESIAGNLLGFKIMPDGLLVDTAGSCVVKYTYFPDRLELDSEINYYLKLNEITVAMGVVGEYLYIKGVLDDAYMWDKRFKSAMFNLLRPKRNIVMPARRWK